jgi:TolB-like protein/tetratricopeptide (TPR) repeat protein
MNVGTRIGPYEITGSIGAGGMGAVYRARDTRLGRDVAIKVLPDDLAADPERLERFEREARATASLNHPNILHIYDVGTHEGVPYIVEELVAGDSLRKGLQHGPLSVRHAVDLATQIARGLAAAHEKHIVHRDLKPENVVVTPDGVAKILDFGLAKLVEPTAPGEADTLTHAPAGATEAGRVLGTVAYMAPEQARGLPVDQRADIFAFGVVLHEMLAGSRPFSGDTATDTIAAIIKEDPAPLPPTVPDGLAEVVRHCLEKRSEDRFQSARDLAFNLQAIGRDRPVSAHPHRGLRRRWLAPAGVALLAVAVAAVFVISYLRKSVGSGAARPGELIKLVVLPFENLGPPEDGYFADGISEEIMSRLAAVRSLGVISRTTAMQYANTKKSVKQIGEELGVAFVLEGTVRWDKSGGAQGRVRISPQLIRVADDTHLWAERYDRVLADVFAMQSEVAGGIVRALGVALAPAEQAGIRRIPTANLEAYDFYLQAVRASYRSRNRADIREWATLAQAAVDLDPAFAEAIALLATSRLRMYWFHLDRSPVELEKAREEAERAAALRPESPEAHLALGYYHYYGRLDYPAALLEFEKALAFEPSNAGAHAAIGLIKRRQGRMSEAEAAFRRSLDLNPRDSEPWTSLGQTLLLSHDYANAVRELEVAFSLNPRSGDNVGWRALAALSSRGEIEVARRLIPGDLAGANLNDDSGKALLTAVRFALIAHDLDAAHRLLAADPRAAIVWHPWFVPKAQLSGELLLMQGRHEAARREFEMALDLAQARLADDRQDANAHSAAGIALAGLGRRDGAIREATEAVRLVPVAKDSFHAPFRVEDLAQVYTMVGEYGKAIDQLDWLLANPSWFSVRLLELEPRWDPLRSHPRFQALLTKYGPAK